MPSCEMRLGRLSPSGAFIGQGLDAYFFWGTCGSKIVIDHQPGCYARQYHGILIAKLIDKEREL